MILYPAIDIRDGAAVRLVKGDYEAETRYDPDPVDAARRWVNDGARWLHVVDLDGAKAGRPVNLESIRRIAGSVDAKVEVGGGIRDLESAEALLAAGVERLVVGTAALRDPAFLDALIGRDPEKVVVGVDARGGKVSVSGWTETSDLDVVDAVDALSRRGVARFLFTPIEVDGTLEGPNISELHRVGEACRSYGTSLIASGGVGRLEDLTALMGERIPAVDGVVVGKALYEGRFTVAEALRRLE